MCQAGQYKCEVRTATIYSQEQTKFARTCKKKGGLFKCCVNYWSLNVFEMSRNQLIKEGLLRGEPTSLCKPGKRDPCMICKADALCTMKNPNTGQITNVFKYHYKKEHKVI